MLLFNLSNDDITSSGLGLKKGVKKDNFWSEKGWGFGELSGTPPHSSKFFGQVEMTLGLVHAGYSLPKE